MTKAGKVAPRGKRFIQTRDYVTGLQKSRKIEMAKVSYRRNNRSGEAAKRSELPKQASVERTIY